MRKRVTILMAMSVILSGCQARSISNSGYPEDAPDAANSNLASLAPTEGEPAGDRETVKAPAGHPVVTGGE